MNRRSMTSGVVVWLLLIAACGSAWAADQSRVLRVAYFIPADRKALDDYQGRIDRVLAHVQEFYRKGMAANGYGPRSFELDRDAQGKLKIYVVRGAEPMRAYGRNDSGKVWNEAQRALAVQGVDLGRETAVIFQLLLEWNGDRASEIGPYVGAGGLDSGTAWVYDDEKLDARLLGSREKGGWYGGPCSIGEFNSHYVGGVAHEMGHAFGLPHDCERTGERGHRGLSLMGAGNHTYGQELRNEGKGSFLSAVSALALSRHPLFIGKPAEPMRAAEAGRPSARLPDLKVTYAGGRLVLSGKIESRRKAIGLAAYNDREDIPGDYDAVGWTAPVRDDGTFALEIGDLETDRRYELRVRTYFDDGRFERFAWRYQVDGHGQPELAAFLESTLLADAVAAFARSDRTATEVAVTEARKQLPKGSAGLRKAEHLLKLLALPKTIAPAAVPAGTKKVAVSALTMEEAKVGWRSPLRDQVLVEGEGWPFIEIGHTFFDTGLYAHAPARHMLKTGGQWKTLSSKYGLQDGHSGSVVFVVVGDGQELFRSPVVKDARVREFSVSVAGVRVMEMRVEDAGDGNNNDWGVWADTFLGR